MFIDLQIILYIVGGICIVVWWYFKQSISNGKEVKRELLDLLNKLNGNIEKLTETIGTIKTQVDKLQAEHDIIKNGGTLATNSSHPCSSR